MNSLAFTVPIGNKLRETEPYTNNHRAGLQFSTALLFPQYRTHFGHSFSEQIHNYCVGLIQKIASGDLENICLDHLDPFGKMIVSYSFRCEEQPFCINITTNTLAARTQRRLNNPATISTSEINQS